MSNFALCGMPNFLFTSICFGHTRLQSRPLDSLFGNTWYSPIKTQHFAARSGKSHGPGWCYIGNLHTIQFVAHHDQEKALLAVNKIKLSLLNSSKFYQPFDIFIYCQRLASTSSIYYTRNHHPGAFYWNGSRQNPSLVNSHFCLSSYSFLILFQPSGPQVSHSMPDEGPSDRVQNPPWLYVPAELLLHQVPRGNKTWEGEEKKQLYDSIVVDIIVLGACSKVLGGIRSTNRRNTSKSLSLAIRNTG